MKINILTRTNILVCIVIIFGFMVTSIISYSSNIGIFKKDVEHVSDLTSEGIYHEIDAIFTKPVNVSLTMANDSLLKAFLSDEDQNKDDTVFLDKMRNYLNGYREKYAYDSVFLVSTHTNRYYHFHGVDRILEKDDPENVWYYHFLKTKDECSLNIDNDQATENQITVFVNCKIRDDKGELLGVVGVGFRVESLQALLKQYEKAFSVRTWLINSQGTIEISTTETGYTNVNLFENSPYVELRKQILENTTEAQSFWYASPKGRGYLVTRYIPNLQWHLVVENDTAPLESALMLQLVRGILVIVIIIAVVLLVITAVIRKYNAQIIELTVSLEKQHRTVFQEATEQLYENIYEVDITHNCAAGESTEQYFTGLGIPARTPYDTALQRIAEKRIAEEYRQGYLDTFSRNNVLAAYNKGVDRLSYDFMTIGDASHSWMRIMASLFFWDNDQSVRMIAYHQNISAQKQHEEHLFEQMQKDALTGLYNKAATQEHIRDLLLKEPDKSFAFFILDIDNFKNVNDTLGHGMGDFVIAEFARTLKNQFRDEDIVGRIGGDEFVVFLAFSHQELIDKKAQDLVSSMHQNFIKEAQSCSVSCSVGIALSPDSGKDFETLYKNADNALYQTKRKGKNGFTIF